MTHALCKASGRTAAALEDDPLPEVWDEYGHERNWDWRFGDDPTPS
jgi:hypothetical protein